MSWSVSLYGASRAAPDLVRMMHFTMKAQNKAELIAKLHQEYVNVSLLKFSPILTVKK